MATPRATIKALVKQTPVNAGKKSSAQKSSSRKAASTTRGSAAKVAKAAAGSAGKSSSSRSTRSTPKPTAARSSGKAQASAARSGKGSKSKPAGDTPRTLIRNLVSAPKEKGSTKKGKQAAAAASPQVTTVASKSAGKASAVTKKSKATGGAKGTPRTLLRSVIQTTTPGGWAIPAPQKTPAVATPGSAVVTPGSVGVITPGSAGPANVSFGATPGSANASFALQTPNTLPAGRQRKSKPLLVASRAANATDKPLEIEKAQKAKRMGVKTPQCPLPKALVNGLLESFSTLPFAPSGKTAAYAALSDFLPQLADDLDVFAEHAGRQTVEDADVLLLMERQRLTRGANKPSAMDLARRHLPMEVVADLVPVAIASNKVIPAPRRKRKRKGGE